MKYAFTLPQIFLFILINFLALVVLSAAVISQTPGQDQEEADISFQAQDFRWKTTIGENFDLHFPAGGNLFYVFRMPDGWNHQGGSEGEITLYPGIERADVVLRKVYPEAGEAFPDFQGEENLKYYARILVQSLPREAENKGKIIRMGRFITFINYTSESMRITFTQNGLEMVRAMGFINIANKPYQIRYVMTCPADSFDQIIADMNRPWSGWQTRTKQEAQDLLQATAEGGFHD